MDSSLVIIASVFFLASDPGKAVNNLDISIAKISGISVDKPVIPALYRVVFDAVAGHDVDLHTVICHKEVAAPTAYGMGTVIEEVVNVKDKIFGGTEKIEKKAFFHVDRGLDVDPVVPVVDQDDPLEKGQLSFAVFVVVNAKSVGLKEAASL